MKNKRSLFIILLLITACQATTPDWPEHILKCLWVPKNAKQVKFYTLNNTYQVTYRLGICYPSKEFIKSFVDAMGEFGWRRLDYDFRNPQIKANYAMAPGGKWDEFLDKKATITYQWLDNFADSKKNIVQYWLRYKGGTNTCDLEVHVIYLPIGEPP